MLLYRKFIQDNVYQILSESTAFCGRHDEKHFGVFFGSQCIYIHAFARCCISE